MNKWQRWSPEDVKFLEENAGVITKKQIAEQLGRSQSSVLYAARYRGIPLRLREKDQHDEYLCRALYKEGLSIPLIASKMEMSRARVFNIIYRNRY